MILAHRIQLDPTYKQAHQFACAAGTARYTWNWALEQWQAHYKETGKSPNVNAMKKRWNADKPSWVYDSPKDANQQPFANLQKAYTRFFKKQAKHPTFKSKHKNRDSFYLSNDKFRVDGRSVRLPKIGWVRMTEELRFGGRIMSATVSRTADRWYISIQVEVQREPKPGTETLGIDLGLKTFATLSTGEQLHAPKPLKKQLKLLRKRSQQHARKAPGGKNREKSRIHLARLHARIANTRRDYLHKTTSQLVSRAKILVIEDLELSGMTKLWGRAVNDLGLHEFRRQLQYKCEMNDVLLVAVSRWYPSSQLCSGCGARQKLTLSQRTYGCPSCGLEIDRDLNAAINIHTAGLAEINAWGHEGSGEQHQLLTKPSWMNQEINRTHI